MKRFFRHLPVRLVFSHVGVAVLVLAIALGVARVTFRQYVVQSQLNGLLAHGREIARVMHGYFSGTLDGGTATYLVRVLQGTLDDRVYVVDTTGQILLEADNGPVPVIAFPADVLKTVLETGVNYTGTVAAPRHAVVAVAGVPITVGGQVAGGIFLAAPLATSEATVNSLTGLLLSAELVAVGAAGGLAFVLSRRLSRPLEALRRTVAEFGAGNTEVRAAVAGPLEVAELAQEFNGLAERIERQVEQLRREAEARDALLAHVAHDLRTPLTSIRGFLEAIRDRVVTGDRLDRAVDIAWEESLRLKRLVDRLLTTTRIRSGIGTTAPIQAADWIRTTLERMEPLANKSGVRIEWSRRDSAVIDGVEDFLVEALINVLENALKWSPPGAVVTVESVLDEGGLLTVTVSDEGPGIAPDILPHVFERFVTGDAARHDSSGLGLAIVYEVINRHRGQVEVANRESGGAIVTIRLPVGASESPEPPAPV